MAKVCISLSGEGRGHATRVRAIIESIRHEHDVSVFASNDAFEFLDGLYRGNRVGVHRISGLRFHYTQKGRLNFLRTGIEAVSSFRRLWHARQALEEHLQREQPDLVVVDFEPILPRAARRLGLPFVSVDHQHFLTTYDLRTLPWRLRLQALLMASVVRGYYSGQRETVVSSFFFPPLRRGCHNVTQVGVMLRPEVLARAPERRGHLVAYWRRFVPSSVLDGLQATRREVRIYGLGEQPRRGNLVFRGIEEHRFLEDLATCDALVSTAGNQLVGEALYLSKPILVLPEARNFEQYINAHFLAQTGAGAWVEMERATPAHFTGFLDGLDRFDAAIDRRRMNGLPKTLAVLRGHLSTTAPSRCAETAVA